MNDLKQSEITGTGHDYQEDEDRIEILSLCCCLDGVIGQLHKQVKALESYQGQPHGSENASWGVQRKIVDMYDVCAYVHVDKARLKLTQEDTLLQRSRSWLTPPTMVGIGRSCTICYGRDCSISSSSCHKRRKLHHQPMSAASMRGTSTVSFCHMSRAHKSTWHKGPSLSAETGTLCRYGNELCVLACFQTMKYCLATLQV